MCIDCIDSYNVCDRPGRPRYIDTIKGKNFIEFLIQTTEPLCIADPKRRSETKVMYLLCICLFVHFFFAKSGLIFYPCTYFYSNHI